MSRVQRTSQSQRQSDSLLNEGMTLLNEEKEDDYATRPQEAIGILTLRLPIHNRRGITYCSRLSLSVDGDVAARARCVSIHHSLTHDWDSDTLLRDQEESRRKEDFDGKKILTGRPGDVVGPTLRLSPLLYRSRDREIFASQVSCEDPAIRGAREEPAVPWLFARSARTIGARLDDDGCIRDGYRC